MVIMRATKGWLRFNSLSIMALFFFVLAISYSSTVLLFMAIFSFMIGIGLLIWYIKPKINIRFDLKKKEKIIKPEAEIEKPVERIETEEDKKFAEMEEEMEE